MDGCYRCQSVMAEYHQGFLDEVLCLYCGKHELKSTNHCGKWVIEVVGGCQECCFNLPNTDAMKKGFSIYECSCNRHYVWSKATGWECGVMID